MQFCWDFVGWIEVVGDFFKLPKMEGMNRVLLTIKNEIFKHFKIKTIKKFKWEPASSIKKMQKKIQWRHKQLHIIIPLRFYNNRNDNKIAIKLYGFACYWCWFIIMVFVMISIDPMMNFWRQQDEGCSKKSFPP